MFLKLTNNQFINLDKVSAIRISDLGEAYRMAHVYYVPEQEYADHYGEYDCDIIYGYLTQHAISVDTE